MRGGDDHRHASRDMRKDRLGQYFALVVGQRELLRVVGQDAQPIRARIDHEVDAALLALKVELAVVPEGGRHHRVYAFVADCACSGHCGVSMADVVRTT
jgi:hypothetical protein